MTLKEKLYQYIDPQIDVVHLEKIADDYAIAFALFLSTECETNGDKDGWWFYNKKWKTTNELLEIFKNNK